MAVSLKDNSKQFNYDKKFYEEARLLPWMLEAKTHPDIQAWWQQIQWQDPNLRTMDILDFMNLQKDQGIYDYQKAIEEKQYPSFQQEHNEYRWSDIGKLAQHPNLNNAE